MSGPTTGPATSGYVPGVCNIGPAEIARRRDTGTAGIAIAVAAVAGAAALGLPKPVRLLAALPAAAGASGLLQAASHFCAGFGFAGLANFGALGSAETTETVEEAADRAADRRKALAIVGGASGIGLAAAGLSLLLP